MNDESRILKAHGVGEAEWAVLFTVSYYTPLPIEQVIELAALELPSDSMEEIPSAIQRCEQHGWIATLRVSPGPSGEEGLVLRGGVVLTEVGLQVKESVSEDLMATVLQVTAAGNRAHCLR